MGKTHRFLTFLYKSMLTGGAFALCALSAVAAQPDRLHSELSDYSRFSVKGNVRPAIASAQDQGAVAASTRLNRMAIHFNMTPSQNADLLQLLRLQQTRNSTQFHKWLTPEQYADRFGLSTADIQKVVAWLESNGFTNVEAARSRNFVAFDGTAGQVQQALGTTIHRYSLNGVSHFANASAPQLPAALNGMVAGIRGLHDFHPMPHAHPHFTSSISGNHYLAPDDFATIYDIQALYGAGITGSGRTIAIPGQTDLTLSDIEAFQTASGLPVKDPQLILTGTDPGLQSSSGDLGESDLDVEWAGAIAKGANIIFVYSTDVLQYSVPYIISNNLADVMPITYGACESEYGNSEMSTLNGLFQQAALEGITIIAASGDYSASDCDAGSSNTQTVAIATQGLAVDFPASSPWVTATGGTMFNAGSGNYWNTTNNAYGGSAISYIPEIAWNDGTLGSNIEGSGGGASIVYPKPSWQTGTGVPNDNARDVPDIALDASPDTDGYITCTNGSCVNGYRAADTTLNITGGTSAASPAFGAIVALLDQQTGERQGPVNQNLYSLAATSSNAFHDITSGNNIVDCRIGTPNCTTGTLGYSAGVGYDQVTGLGSIDAYVMFQEWNSDFAIKPSSTSLTMNHGTSTIATITVSPYKSFTGNVTFTCAVSSSLANVTCSIPGTVSNGSGTATLTITAASNAAVPMLPPNSRGLWYLLAAFLLASSSLLLAPQRRTRSFALAPGLLLAIGLCSCGGGGDGSTTTSTTTSNTTTAESGTISVTGTSGSLTNTTTIAVTIN